jgi:hypothetical protein
MTRQTMMMKQSLKLKEGGNRKTEEDRERKTKIGRITNAFFRPNRERKRKERERKKQREKEKRERDKETEREREKRDKDKDGSHR